MKNILIFVLSAACSLTVFTTLPALATTTESPVLVAAAGTPALSPESQVIFDQVKALGEIANVGWERIPLSGNTQEEMFQSLLEFLEFDGDVDDIEMSATEVEMGESMTYGTALNAVVASDIAVNAMYQFDPELETTYDQAKIDRVEAIFKELAKTKAGYSWNPHGDSVCGVIFTSPIIIDYEAKEAYEINFYGFEGC